MKKFTATILVLFMVVMSGPASVYAAWAEQQNIANPNGSGNLFGATVDISGDYAAVSAVRVTGTSSIHIFKNNGSDVWSIIETIDDPSARGDSWGRRID